MNTFIRPSKHIDHYNFRVYHYRKDARLPVQLQRAMAAEAEAAREARAKVNSFTVLDIGLSKSFNGVSLYYQRIQSILYFSSLYR